MVERAYGGAKRANILLARDPCPSNNGFRWPSSSLGLRSADRKRYRVLNVAQILSGATTAAPERIALRSGDLVMTVEVLNNLAKQCARLFSDEGVGPGHRVAFVMPNVPHFPVVYYGALRTGATAVPLSPLMSAVEFE